MKDEKIHVSATFWRLGSDVWIEAKCGMVMLPPDSPMRAQIPDSALHADPDLDKWVAELRAGPAGPRLAVSLDDMRETASVGQAPVNYQGIKMVQSVWDGRPLYWHARGETVRALWKGKAIASVKCTEGISQVPVIMGLVDDVLWAIHGEFCLMVNDIRSTFKAEQWKRVMREGVHIDVVRGVLARHLGSRYEPRKEGEGVWIGPARLQEKYHAIVAGRYKGCEWHATGPNDPVLATQSGRPVAIVMPAPLNVKGGAA